jgi:biotin carboxyl carrier protein
MSSTPTRRLTITVDGTPYEVEVGDLSASPITVYVNGQPYDVTVTTVGGEPLSDQHGVTAVEPAAGVPRRERTQPRPAGHQVAQVTAPMPGNILDIGVKVGDQVGFREPLCALEAMKMKTLIHSPRDGTIASVEVVEGQSVAHGAVLFTFE